MGRIIAHSRTRLPASCCNAELLIDTGQDLRSGWLCAHTPSGYAGVRKAPRQISDCFYFYDPVVLGEREIPGGELKATGGLQ